MSSADTPTDPRTVGRLQRAIRSQLLPWFDAHQRTLPWRSNRTAYRVWISELMLQQTRVDQVAPYFRRFIRRFPSVRQLAAAPRQDVLKQWEGLGYYARARNLHDTARIIVHERGGRFPRDYDALQALPGIGPYTAAAIASLAFNKNHAVLDGNVIRVLARLMAYEGDTRRGASRRELQQWADALLVRGDAARYNEAMMELGATVCLPRRPRCAECPLRRICAARRSPDGPDAYPRATPRGRVPHKEVGAAVVVNRKGEVLVAQRREKSMLGGLWEFPGGGKEPGETMEQCVARELLEELGIQVDVGSRLMIVRHAYSHFTIALHVYMARIRKGRPRALHCADWRWLPVDRLREVPYSRADLHVVERLQRNDWKIDQ